MPIMPERFIDGFSIPLIFVLLALAGMAVYEIGFRLGRWHQARTRDEQEGFADTLVGALLALLAFLLAFTVGMASSRFDARNDLALREANAIQTAYLRAMMLPEPFAENARELLREYVPLRVREADRAVNEANLRQTLAIQEQLWNGADEAQRQEDDLTMVGLYAEALNQMFDLQTERHVVGVYARVPATVLYMLIVVGILTTIMVGYNAGLVGQRSLASAVILLAVMVAIMVLVIDLDRPADGLLSVSQQALVDLQELISPPQP